jgi:hypothetical protein
MGAVMFHADRRTHMMKQIVTIHYFAKAPRNGLSNSLCLKKQKFIRGAKPRYLQTCLKFPTAKNNAWLFEILLKPVFTEHT